ncbi:hypothetical protein COV18_04705 [Candidatus Woesearchaeota archaeon CG10_big_fil_rev_8_21_14_0_10_37_12]|nr:MAG: hypothetical protein COV18_04705 [Candidatus Woesearchaeota archaeon CG10_big_fil_rev_8_21_14_0_10_37_12]
MNALDTKILFELTKNSRIPLTMLAKKLKRSREVITYRINKLKKEGNIIAFITEIDTSKLGFVASAVFINIRLKRHKEFKEYLAKQNFISWAGAHCGLYSFGFSIYGKDLDDIDKKFFELHKRFKDDIVDYWTRVHKDTFFFYEKCFGRGEQKKIKSSEEHIDNKDKLILKLLAKNSRIEAVRIAEQVKLTAPAVAHKIKRLENAGVIKKYSLFINLSKLNIMQYSVFILNKNMEVRENLLAYLKEHMNISFVATYVSDLVIECGILVSNPYKLRDYLLEIENKFPDNRITHIFLLQEEFFSVGAPDCVFC